MSEPFEPGKTTLKQIEQYGDRWTELGANTQILQLSERMSPEALREFEIFADYDDRFLEKIGSDVSVAVWKEGSLLFEEGSYIDLAFFLVEGEVDVFVAGQGGAPGVRRPIFDVARTSIVPPPEARPEAVEGTVLQTHPGGRPSPSEITMLASMDFNLPKGGGATLGPGEFFGEIGALSGWPQSVTAVARTDCRVVQIRVNALRLMKRKSKALKERIDGIYRERALFSQLKSTPLLSGFSDRMVDALKETVELVSCDADEVVVRRGDPAKDLYLVRSGFLKVLQPYGEGEIVVTYLSKGMTLGDAEVLLDDVETWQTTAVSVEHAELVRIPGETLHQMLRMYPSVGDQLWESAIARLKEAGYAKRHIGHSEFIQVALESGLVQGNSILAIDLNACTRCDDCVRACAETHGGRPRFVREGDKYDNLLIAKSCYHCRDPVCLVGCPTGAIHRAGVLDVVEIDDDICIGCSSCASACPYDAIVMFETGETWPDDMVPTSLRGRDRRVASKCDLCHDTGHGPACVSNCPQGCAYRVGTLEEFHGLLEGS